MNYKTIESKTPLLPPTNGTINFQPGKNIKQYTYTKENE